MRIYQHRSRWEPIDIGKSLLEVTEQAHKLHYKLGRQILAGKIKYYFLIHAKDLREGLLVDNEYSFTYEVYDVFISRFSYEDVYCVTVNVRM